MLLAATLLTRAPIPQLLSRIDPLRRPWNTLAGVNVRSASAGAVKRRFGGPRVVGVAVVVATLAVMPPLVGRVQLAVAAAILLVLTGVALRLRSAPLMRALVFLATVFICQALSTLLDVPVVVVGGLLCVAPLTVLLACNRVAWLQPTAPWLRPGRPTAGTVALGVAAVVGAAIVLPIWATIADPAPSGFLRSLVTAPTWLAVAGIAGFALVNGALEEALFRGVVLGALIESWGVPAAVAGQAVVFGVAHWAGLPSGWLGMVMAGCWGAALGIIRVRSAGILLAYVAHVAVDATIGVLVLVLLR